MKKILSYILFVLFFAFMQNATGQIQEAPISSEHYVKGKIRIKLKKEHLQNISSVKALSVGTDETTLGVASIDRVNKQTGIKRIKRVFPFSLKNEAKHREYGLHLWFELDFDASKDPSSIVEQFKVLDEVAIAKPVYKKVRIDADAKPLAIKLDELKSNGKLSQTKAMAQPNAVGVSFNDPLLADQWHYENDGRVGTANIDIDLTKAWVKETGKSNVIVAIVDGGIDLDHEDLRDNLWINEAELNGKEGVDDDQNGYVDDIHGNNFVLGGSVTAHDHGTHVSGTVAAVSNNGIGVAGVAGGDGSGNGVRLMSCQVFDDRQKGGGNFANAIVYGADNGAVISQNSWGYTGSGRYEPEVLEAVRYFIAEAGQYEGSPMKGGVIFFAAGNDGREQKSYPGSFEEVIAVTATGPSGYATPYTNYGEWTDIAAPGGDQGNFGEEGGVLSTLPDNKYGYFQGTSMACPHVSGVAALVVSRFGGEGFRAEDLEKIILNSTSRFIFDHQGKFGSGILNAYNTLEENERIAPEAVTNFEAAEVFHNQVRLKWTVPHDEDNFQPSNFYLAMGQNEITAQNFDGQKVFEFANPFEAGAEVSVNVSGLIKNTDYWFAIKSGDRFENISNISNIIQITTTDEPHFMESARAIHLDIDVTQGANRTVPLTFSNIGEGIVYWNSSVINERFYWEEQESLETIITEKAEAAAITPELYTATKSYIKPLVTASTSSVKSEAPDYWRKDNTVFMDGMSYESGSGNLSLVGSGNDNAGLILGTRFFVDLNRSFNLTHLEVGIWPEIKEKPILVELKKGSKDIDIMDAETVYVQEYYVDTVNVFKIHRIPIYRPQRFENGDIFWVVLHFPKENQWPLAVEQVYYYPNTFMMSDNNGRSFMDAQTQRWGAKVPMLRALSTGNDGSFVFLDPNEGEITGGESQKVNVIVDAENLTNGEHLASMGIRTNDIHKPGVNIEVRVNVSGHKPVPDPAEVYKYNVYLNRENSLEFDLKNKGLDDLKIYGIRSELAGFAKDFNDTIVIRPGSLGVVPFTFTPANTGVFEANVKLITNAGELEMVTEMICVEAAQLQMSLDKHEINLQKGEKAELELTLKNTGTGTILEYDLEHYDIQGMGNQLPEKLEYRVITSDDANGPLPNQWEDISAFGTGFDKTIWLNQLDLNMQFPFFDEFLKDMEVLFGDLYFYDHGCLGNEPGSNNKKVGSGVLAPLSVRNATVVLDKMIHHGFGDRMVFSFDMNLVSFQGVNMEVFGEFSYQVVLYRDGTVEYRYKNVDDITDDINYIVGFQGMEKDDYVSYRNLGETDKKVHNGMAIRFEPINGISMITKADPSKGIITSGDSVSVKLTVDPAVFDMMAGSYNNVVSVKSNTAAVVDRIPLKVNVFGGAPMFEVNDSLLFGQVRVGKEAVRYTKVSNTGSNKGAISGISFEHADFSFQSELPIEINNSSEYPLPVIFAPTTDGVVNTTMTIDFESGDRHVVSLIGSGKTDPEYVLEIPSNISVDIKGGESLRVPFSITNQDKGVELEYSFQNSVFASAETEGVHKAAGNNEDFVSEEYGYTWAVSDSLKIFHKWEDISADAEVLQVKYEKQQAVKLPFSFPFYGHVYDTIWVSRNGYISLIEPESDNFRVEFTKDDGIRGMIAPFWSSIIPPSDKDGIKLKKEADRIYLQWDAFIGELSNFMGGAITFQLEMVADGSIYFHYKDVEKWMGALQYGLESPDETETFETPKSWILDWSIISDNTTIAIAPPLKEQLVSGEKKDFDLLVSAERIYHSGTYQDTIELRTNSLVQPVQRIPLSLNVTGEPILVAPQRVEWNEVIFSDNCKLKRKIKIYNKGYETLSLTKVGFEQLEDLNLYDKSGQKFAKNSAGTLLKAIEIEPWCFEEIELEIPVEQKVNVEGLINLTGNFDPVSISIVASIVDSPIFAWNAEDKEYTPNNTKKETYTFTIENEGETTLNFDLVPAVVPSGDTGNSSVVVDNLGQIEFDRPRMVDSLALETKEVADGVFTPTVVGNTLGFANEFVAPEGGFFLTHVKNYNYLKKLGEYLRVMVYVGGDDPQSGEMVYQQDFIIDEIVDGQWIYLALKQPINIPEGEKFYVLVCPPRDFKFIGFDITTDESLLEKSYSGVYMGNGDYTWRTNPKWSQQVWKIRSVTAAGNGQWIELNQLHGEVKAGASVDVSATIDPEGAGIGINTAKIFVSTNDVNHPKDEATITVIVNGAPELKFRPNQYVNTLKMVETEELTLNYLFQDPEGESMSISMEAVNGGPEAKMTQTGDKTAQVEFKTDYQSAGVYSYPVAIEDEAGNITRDTIHLEVSDKNRAPVMNPDFGTITLNLADPMQAYTIDPSELFSDPDGDDLQIVAGNYTPEIVDMALGYNYIDIHPLEEGTGFLVFGADDGKENGFVIYGVYVQVINDPDAMNGAPDSLSEEDETFMESAQSLSVYPNPVINETSTVQFKLDKNADARFEIYNLIGRKLNVIQEKNLNSGVHRKQVDFTKFGTGLYICRYLVNGKFIESKKVVVK